MIRHELSYELINDLLLAFSHGEYWLAYNKSLFYLDKGQVLSFRDYEKASAFVETKISAEDNFQLIRARSIADVFKQIPYEKNLYLTLNQEVMNEKNLAYLKDNLKYMGFGEGLSAQLEKEMIAGGPQFQLHFQTALNKKPFEAVLNFRKSENSELYFFNSYQASLRRSNGDVVDQAFYLNKGKGVTAKEAYNLLEGRAIYKELTNKDGQTYHAWLQLDLSKRDKLGNHEVRQYHQNYGFSLPDALQKFPVKELQEADLKDVLLRSLEKGNLQAVTFIQEGSVQKMFVEAAPQYKTINVYDGQLKRVQKEDLHQYAAKDYKQENKLQLDEKPAPAKEAKQVNGAVVEKPKRSNTHGKKRSPGA